MTKTQRKPLFDQRIPQYARTFELPVGIFLSFIFFLSPVYFFSRMRQSAALPFFLLIYFGFFVVIYVIYSRYSKKEASSRLEKEAVDERRASLRLELHRVKGQNDALLNKIAGYMNLSIFAEHLVKAMHIDEVVPLLVNVSYERVLSSKGNCLFYLLDARTQELKLISSRKEDQDVIIKAKKGDIFDQWVIRQGKALIVEDTRKDFRFDSEKSFLDSSHRIGSLICVPLVSSKRILGLLRRESPDREAFNVDDLRLLMSIGDFGAAALENAQLYEQAEELAMHDGLTGLYVRRYFMDKLKDEISRENNFFSLIMADIDLFKGYNDKYGHTAGDIVLKRISEVFSEVCRPHLGVVSRFGGEEFAILIPRFRLKEALALAERLRQAVSSKEIVLRRQPTYVSISLGLAVFPDNAVSAEELIYAADKALYSAKESGRNRVCCA